jgi:cellulose synthase operon protein C
MFGAYCNLPSRLFCRANVTSGIKYRPGLPHAGTLPRFNEVSLMRWSAVVGCALPILLLCPASADVKSGREALLHGDWAAAETRLKAAPPAEKGPAQLALGELYLTTGRYPEALQQAALGQQVPASRAAALVLAGEIQRETGKTTEAILSFQNALKAAPGDLRARVYLGITLQETGQQALAEKLLDQFFQDFNAGKINTKRADHLTYTAMAARRLRSWEDASNTFQDAAELDASYLLANVEWGELFLQKYNSDDAQKCFDAVLKINKSLPRALMGMAATRIEAAYDVAGATKLADEALKTNPNYVPAFCLKAHLALDDERFTEAEAHLKKALAVNPNDLESRSLLAASRYLQDDTKGFEVQKNLVLKQNPRYSDLFLHVGELAVRQHWYAEATQLFRLGLALDPKNEAVSAALGLNLLRLGIDREPEALKVLDQAFKADPFNVRTLNTLNLYEKVIAKDYETVKSGAFVFRFAKAERPLLERYVPPFMQRAWDAYVKKYGFTPKTPITVEFFTERQHYGARTTGLPEIGAQGTCFGDLVTAMSPSSAEASWELVIWHELGHVFHLKLSNNRAPRWFTEGLAEYETNVERPYWKREHSRDIYLSLRRGDLWKIGELSAAFTRPGRENGVVIAYQQSSLVIHYLAEKFGYPKLVEALKLYGQGKRDDQVLPAITGKTMAELDQGFRDYLTAKYAHYAAGFNFDPEVYEDLKKIKADADAKPSDPAAQSTLAAAMMAHADEGAKAQAQKALALDQKNVLARYVLARSLQKEDAKASRAEFETLLAQGTDGYVIRVALARFAGADGDIEGAIKHLQAAKKLDPDSGEPYVLLTQLYEAKERRDDLLRETEAYLDLQEHDHDSARLLIDRFAAEKRWADVVRIAPRVIGITPMEPFVHQQYGLALGALGKPKEAIYELESALAAGPRKPGAVRAALATQYLAAGDKMKARAAAEQALKDEPNNAEARDVLEKTKP